MSSMYTSDGHFWRNLATRILLVSVTTTIIALALSHTSESTLHYTIGKPWTQPAVIAPFEFPIKKTPTVLDAQRDSVTRSVIPYYDYFPTISEQQSKRFLGRYAGGIEGLPKSFSTAVAKKLHELYAVGIIEQDAYSQLMKDTNAVVRLVQGKTTKIKRVRELLTPMTAYEAFFADNQMLAVKQQLQQCNINEYILPNIKYNSKYTENELTDAISHIIATDGTVQQGERIVDRGEVVTAEIARKLATYEEVVLVEEAATNKVYMIVGRIIFIMLIIITFTTYLHLFRGDYFRKPRSLAMVYTLITLFPVLGAITVQVNYFPIYLVPFAMVPMFIRVFLDSRTAFMAHTVMILLCSMVVSARYEFVVIELTAGLVAIYSLRELSKRSQIFIGALFTTVASCLILFTLRVMSGDASRAVDDSLYLYIMCSGVLLLLVYPLMFLIEKMFGFTSSVTLFELSDTNRDILRRLSEVAPGTFQHSIMVGNLAAAIAARVGAKPLLVRTGALYHDIGKMENPVFFTENQVGTNPHDRMTPIESAQVIINHVTEGVRMAERNGLPDVIRDFILTHHGAGKAKYFYITYKNEHPNEDVNEKFFSYPGPNPFTKEQAILMMADSVEAASRSLTEYTEETITTLVNRIIDSQVSEGYFHDCPITFQDIDTAKNVLIEKLKSIYHTRISYPELKSVAEKA